MAWITAYLNLTGWSSFMAGQRYTGRRRAYVAPQAVLEDFVKETEQRMTAIVRASVQDVINEAQQPVAKGGRMRVDTGFLRASGQMSLTGLPSGPARGDSEKPNSYSFNEQGVTTQLGNYKLGGTIYFAWTANYAKYRELYDGFLEGALRHWSRIVAFNTDDLRRRLGK